ncbi:uncharacterized protein BHQ10_003344 [Talaromyces amestolkiae]|uniref:Uncharacterized protein n=1 Tax=Talaromyces amestolkiae TaxID=1196081 RepID=A0A364KUV5_TALAM|nr:uncharacterized protein BHQ10_003344 [Talaromyces amestolkiae]RAO67332.1 hypothetical protein BHQ10_003344 [Talaromyces amestolkiae]
MTEEQELLAKIGQLAGQINQHKNQHQHPAPPTGYHARHPRAGWAPYRGRGARGRPAAHRNRTLILNNNTADASKTDSTDNATPPPASTNGWIAKRDRHMQLINTSIYDKEVQARTKAIAETEKTKREKRAKAEEAKVMRYAQGVHSVHATPAAGPSGVATQPSSSYQIYIHDTPFQVVRGGSKLIRQSNDPKNANATPKKVVVGGVTFVRSKKGNLHRLGAVVAKRKPSKIKRKNELCKRFSRTGTRFSPYYTTILYDAKAARLVLSKYKDPTARTSTTQIKWQSAKSFCKLVNVAQEIAVTSRMSHHLIDHLFVSISFEAAAQTRNVATHMSASRLEHPSAAILQYWDIAKRAQNALIDMSMNALIMPTRGKATAAAKTSPDGEDEDEEDVSSEEEEYDEIDSDDVDSDELDSDEDEPMMEFVEGGTDDRELSGQQDFVHF